MCTRVLWANNDQAILVGRNMDWYHRMPVNLWSVPQGMARDGMTGKNSLTWTSQYGSILAVVPVTRQTAAASDGMNEQGLAVNALWLGESDYGQRDESRPGLSAALWVQYYLDNFATVQAAVTWTLEVPYQIVTLEYDGQIVAMHLALEDATGDSAIITPD